MILRELLYKGPRRIAPRASHSGGSAVPTRCYQNFYQIFYQKRTTFDKNYQKDNFWGSFLLVRTVD